MASCSIIHRGSVIERQFPPRGSVEKAKLHFSREMSVSGWQSTPSKMPPADLFHDIRQCRLRRLSPAEHPTTTSTAKTIAARLLRGLERKTISSGRNTQLTAAICKFHCCFSRGLTVIASTFPVHHHHHWFRYWFVWKCVSPHFTIESDCFVRISSENQLHPLRFQTGIFPVDSPEYSRKRLAARLKCGETCKYPCYSLFRPSGIRWDSVAGFSNFEQARITLINHR